MRSAEPKAAAKRHTARTSSLGRRLLGTARVTFNAWFDVPGSLHAVCLIRATLGPILIVHLWPFLEDMGQARYYADSYHSPWFQAFPTAPKMLYFALLIACVGASVLVSLGLHTRWAVTYAALFVSYNFFASQTHFRHNRNFLILVLWVLALMPCGRLFSLDAWRRRRQAPRVQDAPGAWLFQARADARASLWPSYLLRFEVVCVYAASGSSKLLNPDWRSGIVNWERLLWYQRDLARAGVPQSVVRWLTELSFHSVFSKLAIATELAIALGLLWTRTRYPAVWVAIVFHLVIGIALRVQIFSYLAISVLLIWATPRTFERTLLVDPDSDAALRFARWVRRLDWTHRFRFEPVPGAVHSLTLIEPLGQRFTGGAAGRLALLRCPALFFPLFPIAFGDWLRIRAEPSRADAASE